MAVTVDGKLLLEIGGIQEWSEFVLWWVNGKFLKPLYIVGKGVLTPYFLKFPLYCLLLPFPYFCLPPPLPPLPCHLQPSSPLLFLLFCLFWVNEWSQHIWCAVLLNENMDMHTSNLDTLVPEGSWCLFYVTRCHVYWSLTDNVVF